MFGLAAKLDEEKKKNMVIYIHANNAEVLQLHEGDGFV